MILVENLLSGIIANLNLKVDIYFVEVLSDSRYKCYTLNTHWLNTKSRLTIDGNDYKVTDFTINKFFIVQEENKQALAPSTGEKPLQNPYFVAGSLTQTNFELLLKARSNGNTSTWFPIVWCFNRQTRSRSADVDSVIDSEGSVRLFFLNSDKYGDYLSEKRRTEIIEPMMSLAQSTYSSIKKSTQTGLIGSTDFISHEKFIVGGDSVSQSEDTNILTVSMLSGVEASIDIPIKRSMVCPTRQSITVNGFAFGSGFNIGFDIE